MNKEISKLQTPQECWQFAKIHDDIAPEAYRRAIELRVLKYVDIEGEINKVEKELLKALYAYEDVLSEKNQRRTSAARTWGMVKRYGIIGAAERAVSSSFRTMGWETLVKMGLQDMTFESVIVRFPSSFPREVVLRAAARLDELKRFHSYKSDIHR
jgi:hypothetical protein